MKTPATLTDPLWQDAATWNASRGYPWAVWGSCRGGPLGLHDSKRTKEEAEAFAAKLRVSVRPRGQWTFIVTEEGGT